MHRYVIEAPMELSQEEWEKTYSLPARPRRSAMNSAGYRCLNPHCEPPLVPLFPEETAFQLGGRKKKKTPPGTRWTGFDLPAHQNLRTT
jgi:hypothetical protein